MGSGVHFSAKHHAITQGVPRQCTRFQVCKTHNKHGGARPTSQNVVSTSLVSSLRYRLFLSILQAISNEKNILLHHCAGTYSVNKNCDVDVAINNTGYQSKTQQEKTTLEIFFVCFTRPASPLAIYGSLPLPLMLLMSRAQKKTLLAGIRLYSCGIAGVTEQRTAFTRAQSAILQSQDFNLCVRVEHMLKITYPRSYR